MPRTIGLLREGKCFAAEILHERGLRLSTIREELAPSSKKEAQPQRDPILRRFTFWLTVRRAPFWLTVRRARGEIEAIARQYCATAKADSLRGATPKHLSFRIAVPTDREPDYMRGEPQLPQELSGALLRVGYPADAVPFVHFRIESQETVDRDYGGSWVEESEMP